MSVDFSQRPSPEHHSEYHETLVAKVPDGDILDRLSEQIMTFAGFTASIPINQTDVVHPPYGWSIRQVIEHSLDAERVFGYRMLRFANGDTTELPGWDENVYAVSGYGPTADLNELAAEFVALRQANICLMKRLSPKTWDMVGIADERSFSVRTLAWLMAGHLIHHVDILKQRLGMS